MRYLLLPITLILWIIIMYLCLWCVYAGILLIVSLGWLWIILGFTVIIALISIFATGIPALLGVAVIKIYKNNRFINILHALAGLISVVLFISFFFSEASMFTIKKLYEVEKWKIIILAFPFVGLILASLYSTFVIGFAPKPENYFEEEEEFTDDELMKINIKALEEILEQQKRGELKK